MQVIGLSVSVVFALGGRWIQPFPERLVPKGQFVGADSRGARFYRVQTASLGTFMVFAGTWGAIFSLVSLLGNGSALLAWIGHLLGVAAGIFAAARVRGEAKLRPPYVSNSPYGWWPNYRARDSLLHQVARVRFDH
jgi:membrane associated rhomboid family serine protease